jgi:hypothetical protein
MLLTEHTIITFPINPLNLQKVISPSGTLYMKRDLTPRMLTLNTGPTVLLPTDDTLKIEALEFDLVHADGSTWGH